MSRTRNTHPKSQSLLSQGGLKAVVWTDVIQTMMMFSAILLVIIKGTTDIGGVGVLWERAMESGRIEPPE